MKDLELYNRILGLQHPWIVEDVKLDIANKTIIIIVSYASKVEFVCPECQAPVTIYDHRLRRWRHLDTCQMTTMIECRLPRLSCPSHGIKQALVPWAEPRSRFTALFESLVIDWLKETSILGVSKLLGLTWDEVAGIQERAVERGLARREKKPVVDVGIDETSFQKRHEYVTTIYDKQQDAVLDVLNDRASETLEAWFQAQPKEQWDTLETISMDMWDPYIRAVSQSIEKAQEKICFDRFHVAQHFGNAVNKVRAKEHRSFIQSGEESPLTKTKYEWLTNASRVDNRTRLEFMALTRSTLKTARAWAIKEMASKLWSFTYRKSAEKAWSQLLGWIRRCRLEPVIKVGAMIRKYFWGILNAILLKVSNAKSESINAKIQRVKKVACGFRNRERFRMSILFHLGKLDMKPCITYNNHSKP